MQGTSQERRAAIRELAARKARELALLPNGFWFHDDVRDNFYYAIHLFAACVGQDVKKAGCGEADRQAFRLAADMIGKVLKLQVQEEVDPMYGHWPLRLSDNPAESKPNSLPVELMGCLLIYFYHTYLQELPLDLKSDINIAILHIYQSGAYRRPLQKMNHHEAKHTALKLLLGHQFDDRELLEEGVGCMQRQLAHIGCLPKGDWRFLGRSGYGRIGDVYVVFHLMNEYDIVEKEDRISIASSLESGLGGVVVEAMSCREASVLGIDSVDRFADSAHSRSAVFACSNDADGVDGATSAEGQLEAFYKTKRNDELALHVRATGKCPQAVNGQPVNWGEYRVN